jgi:ATP-dependent helicase Lhr and Lhr-like helicase
MNPRLEQWFTTRGWEPFDFQRAALDAFARGESGLIHAPTGVGKTLAAWLPPLAAWLDEHPDASAWPKDPVPLRVLWLTPLRALAQDTLRSLREATTDLGLPWTIDARTGDTSGSRKSKQRERFPTALVTTPESLSLLLSYPETQAALASLRCVVVDEWHELMGTKRGVQTELALARLRRWCPGLRTWGLSATLGNLPEAMATLLGQGAPEGRLISSALPKRVEVETLLPDTMEKFPWGGHLGLRLLPSVIAAIERARTTLVFTNVRSQTEIWYQALLDARPDWADTLGIHHGSLDREERARAEEGLRTGQLRAVVCTSSLDLGVDFSPVEQVIQIGGPKGIARLRQRAGRSGHGPGRVSRVLCVPAHALELVEYAAAREALDRGEVEPRRPLDAPLDLLAQHLVTLALGGGFTPDEALAEVRTTRAYRDLSAESFHWVLEFVMRGGRSLRAYPGFCRVAEENGRCVVTSPVITRLHRMSIGTITSDAAIRVQFQSGARLGTVEESFIARLKPGQHFIFGGRVLQLVRVHQMVAHVRAARRASGTVPQWEGGRSPLSSLLAERVRHVLEHAEQPGASDPPELQAVRPILAIQGASSRIPRHDELLIERTTTREGTHWFLFPFGGRLAHEGLGALLAFRLSRRQPVTVTMAVNDYGVELLPAQALELGEADWRELLSPDRLVEDLLACLNATELARRQFREIARVAGLVFPGYPGAQKTMKQVQASSGLLFEVFQKYEPEHLLLDQARREVLDQQLEISRLRALLEQAARQRMVLTRPVRLTPLAFPLWAEMIRGQVSSESWSDRVRRMAAQLEEESAR